MSHGLGFKSGLVARMEQAGVLAAGTTAPAVSGIGHALGQLRSALDRREARPMTLGTCGSEALPTLAEAFPSGREVMTERGCAWVSEEVFPLTHRHGDLPLGDFVTADFAHVQTLTGDARLSAFAAREALFLDIETTGLEHGAGNVAFLVGLGHFEDDGFHLRQVVLREPNEEAALLAYVWEALTEHTYLASFNGKSFDISVLQHRLVLQRFCSARESALKLKPHFDLLHLGRALYRGLWPDARLQTLEARRLGFVRDGDMPGALAPECYFAWLRDGDARPLAGIARHNAHDVMSMTVLAAALAADARPVGDAGRRGLVALNVARLYARRRAYGTALAVLDELPPLLEHAERVEAARLGVTCARRAREPAAHGAWLEALIALMPDEPAARAARARLIAAAERPRRPARARVVESERGA